MIDETPNFKKAMQNAGLPNKDQIVGDGKLHRFHVTGDKMGSKNGWYILYSDGMPAGCFGNWKTGETFKWCIKPDRELTTAQRSDNRQRMLEAQKIREAEELKRHQQAKLKSLSIWRSALLAPDTHPYLMRKGVKAYNLRVYKGSLVIPMRDSAGNLHSLQFIDGEGNKRFLSGGRKQGCYFSIGSLLGTLCIAEGYATAASIHEVTGYACAVAFDAGNLLSVAKALKTKFPDIGIIVCADNDENTIGNPGLTKAREAAVAIGALLAVPPCEGDFNDLWVRGLK